ncbi:MFS transporter [Ghiorsea bivora]|uniref:MFS transporter n=1 Tax=Ghiorsea bivora TaxID=1485545 RepID=UPI00068CB67E|nr:MFS transporter [Ghiorsea bivora]
MISNQSLIAIRLFYAAYFAAMGLILPYFPVYLTDLGMSTVWVGIFVGALAAAKVIAPPLAGLLLEYRNTNTRTFLLLTSGLATSASALLIPHWDINVLLTIVIVFGFFWAAILPLTDGLSLVVSEISIMSYGRLRVWGSVGFVIASFAGGLYLVGNSISLFPWILTSLLALTTLAAIGFPDLSTISKQNNQQPSSQPNPKALMWLLFIGFCMQASHGAYYGFFSLYMIDAGYSGAEIGFFWILGVLAEILLMWYWSKSIQKASPVWVLGLCLLLASLRWFGLAITTNIVAILLLQLLHAASFAAFHLSAVAWVRKFAQPHRQTSAQGWYSSIGFGLGSTLGIMLCGMIVETQGYAAAFYACTFIALLGLLAVWKLKQANTMT